MKYRHLNKWIKQLPTSAKALVIIGLIISTMYNMLASIIRALGDSKTPLYYLIVSSIANIILAIYFVII